MSTWNHRVVRRTTEHVLGGKTFAETVYGIHEVHSSEEDPDRIGLWTVDPVDVVCSDLEGLRWTLEHMLAALDKPVLDYEDMVGEPMTASLPRRVDE